MKSPSLPTIKTGRGTDLAFSLVVLASYFAIFSMMREASTIDLLLMIALGIAYIGVGTYGYSYCATRKDPLLRLGYFFAQIGLGMAIVYLGRGAGYNVLLLLPLAGQSVILLPKRWMYVVNIAIVFGYVVAVFSYSPGWDNLWNGLQIFLAGQIFILAFTQMAVSEEKARTEVVQLVNTLAEANQRLREYALQVEELATTKERNRLAREIHDGLGHYLTTIYMQLQAARAIINNDPQRGLAAVKIAQDLAQDALLDVRRSVASLREPTENLPLPEKISRVLKIFENDPLVTNFKVLGSIRLLSPETEWTLYRAVQEGLNNAHTHAQASQVWITLDYSDDKTVHLTISDDGIGAEQVEGGYGLIGLRERVQLLHGEIDLSTAVGQGFTIKISLPG